MTLKQRILYFLPLRLYLFLKFIRPLRYLPNFKNFRSFNEYLNHIKLYDRDPMRQIFCDRLAVREYVRLRTNEVNLISLLWFGTYFTKNVWESMPEKFVLKQADGSGMVMVVDKGKDSLDDVYCEIDKWKKLKFHSITRGEWFYRSLPRILLCEEFLSNKGKVPEDFKFFVVGGKVELIQVDYDRFEDHTRNLYTRDFAPLNVALRYKSKPSHIPKPKLFYKAVEIAEALGKGFPFLRVDLYLLDRAIYFGEITNTPEGGFGEFYPESYDFDLGQKIKLALSEIKQ